MRVGNVAGIYVENFCQVRLVSLIIPLHGSEGADREFLILSSCEKDLTPYPYLEANSDPIFGSHPRTKAIFAWQIDSIYM